MTMFYPVIVAMLVISMLFSSGLVAGDLGLNQITRNREHADAKHPEATLLREAAYAGGPCQQYELYVAPIKGTVLALCQPEGAELDALWLGVAWRVFENNATKALTPDEAYEVTCMMAPYRYWRWIVRRDGYVPLYMRKDLIGMLMRVFGLK